MAIERKDRPARRRRSVEKPLTRSGEDEPVRADETATISRHNLQRAVMSDDRRREIAEAAYYRAESRGFVAGHEESDWLEAEKEVDSRHESEAEGRSRH
ncbi:MAG: DUF2934 domain-containing protein [Gammaproteobacteria bacterium]